MKPAYTDRLAARRSRGPDRWTRVPCRICGTKTRRAEGVCRDCRSKMDRSHTATLFDA